MLDEFQPMTVDVGETSLFAMMAGTGPPLLLVHGFPETHLMWRDIAPALAREFTVVLVDLRGYGASGCPPATPDHAAYSKRAMAGDLHRLMGRLGFDRFAVAGHDRGGRVAYRLALDYPARVTRLAVLDIVPTVTAWELADDQFALAYWPWLFLAQPSPLPEQLLTLASAAVIDDAIQGWGSAPAAFPAPVRDAYAAQLRDPAHAHAICEEYRAAAGIDREHDAADRAAGRRITCPLLALWGEAGPLDTWYSAQGGPLGLWREWATDVRGHALAGGHFFPEAAPAATTAALRAFFAGNNSPA